MSIGPSEFIILFLIALIVFGPNKLPEIGRTVGQAIKELKRMSSDVTSAFEDAMQEKRAISDSYEWEGSDPYSDQMEEDIQVDEPVDEAGPEDENTDYAAQNVVEISPLDNHDKIVCDANEIDLPDEDVDTTLAKGPDTASTSAAERSELT